jgi:adenosylmethionine-8-amino-7-oxononanoate aminotransferase
MFGGKLPGFLHIKSPYPYRFVSEDQSVSPGVAAARTCSKRRSCRKGRRLSLAFIAEPVQGSGGLIVPPDDYFPRIREDLRQVRCALHCRRNHHRLSVEPGAGLGLERYGVEPDILAFAKGITSGYNTTSAALVLSDRVHKVMSDAPPRSDGCACLHVLGAPCRLRSGPCRDCCLRKG